MLDEAERVVHRHVRRPHQRRHRHQLVDAWHRRRQGLPGQPKVSSLDSVRRFLLCQELDLSFLGTKITNMKISRNQQSVGPKMGTLGHFSGALSPLFGKIMFLK